METIEQATHIPGPGTSVPPLPTPPVVQQTQTVRALSPTKILPAITSFILLLTTVVLGFRTWETVLFPVYQILRQRSEIIWEGNASYTPYAWLVKIKQANQPRTTFSVEARDSVRMVPAFIGDVQTLKFIYIMYQPIRSLPDSIGSLQNLQEVYINNTLLSTLPSSIGNLTNLQALSLEGNRLTSLPDSIGNLTNLRVLNLAYNRLSSLPPSLANLSNLLILDLTGNNLHTFPTNLPPHLGALFLGGNPIPHKVVEASWPGTAGPGSYEIFH
ncbi:leucine-rich repeat domain-containing protein [Candidatus Gottesmanbacteria bacterium]|nr:leucine-rich repeat domain-containing protein [Candidatus Gottesmanbacteria bacterium]